MAFESVWVDLAALVTIQPDGDLIQFPDVPDAVSQWRSLGLAVVAMTTDAHRYGARLPKVLGDSIPVVERPLPQWRQVGTWLDLAGSMRVSSEQVVFVASTPMLMRFANEAGMTTIGVLRDTHTMTVLDGVWVDELSAIPWLDLLAGAFDNSPA